MSTHAFDEIELEDGRRIDGFVEEGFGGVMDAFVANFAERQDLGAGCAVYADGRPVVDVWGGIADRRSGTEWTHKTTAVVFSCSKGLLTICVYRLADEGKLDVDAPIVRYWPEFGRSGKSGITIRDALTHRAGLPALDVDLTKDQVLAWDPVIRAIEAQPPMYARTDGHFYHAMTYGWLVGEVIRRITGLTPGSFFRQSLGDRLGLRTWIGLPAEEQARVAWMEAPLPDEDSDAARENARVAKDNALVDRSLTMSGAFAFPAEDEYVTFNDPAIRAGEIPGANGISTAESLARLYGACVSDIDGAPILSASSLADACRPRASGPQLSGLPDDGARWGTGFQLASPPNQPMLGRGSFGHAGAGGQLAFGDVDHRIGFAYLSNQMGGYGDVRARALSGAVKTALGA
ncbi:MAG TPA: serine hydrolase domain-containing protein [Actinomycetota bacterium]